jgi:hypothetical protein
MREFRLALGLVDNEFEPMRRAMMDIGMELNTVAKDEHVPEVERHIRTLKERTRSVYNTVPFLRMPTMMTVEMVYSRQFWLNIFPPSDGGCLRNCEPSWISVRPQDRLRQALPHRVWRLHTNPRGTQQRHDDSNHRSNSLASNRQRPRWVLLHESHHRAPPKPNRMDTLTNATGRREPRPRAGMTQ